MGSTGIYVRVSTTKQSNDRQIENCREHLSDEERKNHKLYADIGSGADPDRNDIQRLRQDIRDGKIEKVVTWEISRIGRNLSFVSQFIDLCVEENVELETVNDAFPGVRPDNDIFSKMINQLIAWMTEFERAMIKERVQSGVNRAIEQGKWVGRPPYGFTTDEDGYLTIKTDDYLAMQYAVERALSDSDDSINRIATAFGVPQSSLDRIVKDREKQQLYLSGDTEDKRVTEALEEAEIKPSKVLTDLKSRVEALEKAVGD